MKKKILIVGGSHSEIPLVNAAKELGLYVITTGNQSNGLAHKYSDEYHICDYSDNEAIYQLAKKLQIDYICFGAHDLSYFSTVYAASKLGLDVFDDMDTAKILHHKDKFKFFCLRHNILSPRANSFSSEHEAITHTLKNVHLPCIVKPIDMGGGKGISKINTKEEIEGSIKNAFYYSKSKVIVVEEFFEGSLHSFSTFIVDKKVKFYFEDTELPCKNNPYGVCTSISPSPEFENIKDVLVKETEKVANLLNLKDGLLHMQYLRNIQQIAIVEFTRRMPGDFYAKPVLLSTGVDYAEWALKSSCGFDLNALVHKDQTGYYSRHCVMAEQNGQIEDLVIDPLIKDNIIETFMWWKKGDEIVDFMTYKAGIIFLKYDTCEEMDEKNAKLHKLIRIEL